MRINLLAAILVAIILCMLPGTAQAQCNGQFAAGNICGNPTGALATPRSAAPSAFSLVASLGGMTGAITCGTNLTCAGGIISAPGGSGSVTSVATASPITGGTITSTGTIGCATCVTSAAALTANQLVIGGGLQATATLGSLGTVNQVLHGNAAGAPTFAAVSLTADVSGILPVANGGTGLASGTSGGVLTYTAAGTFTSSGILTANNPVIGGGAGAVVASGTRSGNTTVFATTTGVLVSGNCVQIDANGNLVDAGGACSTGTGGGTVAAGTAGQLAYYGSTGTTVIGNANVTVSAGVVTFGIANSVLGSLKVTGNISGTITIAPQAAAGTYNFNLPIVAGTSGAPLLSAGGGASPMTFGTVGVAFGGTGLTSGTSGGVLGFTASGTIASSIALTANALVLGGGAGATPTPMGSLGTTTTVLHGNAAGAPTFGSVVSGDLALTVTTCTNQFATAISATAVLTCTTATLASAQFANQGATAQVLHGNGAGNPTWAAVNVGTEVTGTLLVANGGTGLATLTNHGVLVGAGTSNITQLAAAAAGTVLAGQGATTDPLFTATPTLGVAGTTLGSLALAGNAGGTVTISVNATAGTYTFKLPNSAGTSGQLLSTDGSGNLSWTGTLAATIITSSANPCLAVGPNGNTNPMFRVVCNVASAATGFQVTGNAAAAGVDLVAISSGTNESLTLNAKGSGQVAIAGVSTGNVTLANGTAQVRIGINASATVPAITFNSTNADGFNSSGAGTLNFIVNSVNAVSITQTQINLGFGTNTNTFIKSDSANEIDFYANNVEVLAMTSAANSNGIFQTTQPVQHTYSGGGRTIASAAGATWTDFAVTGAGLVTTFSGSTNITSDIAKSVFGTPSITASGLAISSAATVQINAAPAIGSGTATITAAWALKIAGGNIGLSAGSQYINFGAGSGSGGCGFRDNAGTMQVANCSAPGTWANFGAGGGMTLLDSQAFTSNGTWTKVSGAKYVVVVAIGGAGAGGSGASGSNASNRGGGASGAGGGVTWMTFDAGQLGATVSVTVGAAVTGGTGVTGNTSGNAGADGNASSFGTLAWAGGGFGGAGGTTGATGTASAGTGLSNGSVGTQANAAVGAAIPGARAGGFGCSAGGNGGNLNTAGTAFAGGDGGGQSTLRSGSTATGGGGVGGAATGVAGTAGTSNTGVATSDTGYGSGGGGGNPSGNGGAGAAGGAPCGGGGGGGAARDTNTSGAGGGGARGEVRVWTYGLMLMFGWAGVRRRRPANDNQSEPAANAA